VSSGPLNLAQPTNYRWPSGLCQPAWSKGRRPPRACVYIYQMHRANSHIGGAMMTARIRSWYKNVFWLIDWLNTAVSIAVSITITYFRMDQRVFSPWSSSTPRRRDAYNIECRCLGSYKQWLLLCSIHLHCVSEKDIPTLSTVTWKSTIRFKWFLTRIFLRELGIIWPFNSHLTSHMLVLYMENKEPMK